MTAEASASATAQDFHSVLPQLHQRFIEAYNRRDFVSVVDCYTKTHMWCDRIRSCTRPGCNPRLPRGADAGWPAVHLYNDSGCGG
jgi:hypothetical protein